MQLRSVDYVCSDYKWRETIPRSKRGEGCPKPESLPEDAGTSVQFDKILMIGEGEKVQVGSPYLDACKVSGTILSKGRHKKIKIIKFHRRKHHMKSQGHRQNYTEVKITQINNG